MALDQGMARGLKSFIRIFFALEMCRFIVRWNWSINIGNMLRRFVRLTGFDRCDVSCWIISRILDAWKIVANSDERDNVSIRVFFLFFLLKLFVKINSFPLPFRYLCDFNRILAFYSSFFFYFYYILLFFSVKEICFYVISFSSIIKTVLLRSWRTGLN